MNQPQLGSFESIPLSAIRPSGTNPRKHFDPLAMEELTRSVSEMGVTQPLLLRPIPIYQVHSRGTFVRYAVPVVLGVEKMGDQEWQTAHVVDQRVRSFGDGTEEENEAAAQEWVAEQNEDIGGFQIVSGERRYRAAQEAGLKAVPAIVRALTDAEALDIQMIENLQRADLHPVEEAEGYRVLMANGATAEDVAKKSGKTLGYVQQRIKLLSLELDAKQLFADGHLTLGHALLLARLTAVEQDKAIRWMLEARLYDPKLPTHDLIAKRVEGTKWHGKRLIDQTESELKTWIQSHVLLQLAGVPWDLGDAELLPVAGPCTTCPKRTGANAALFQDLTVADDICTDPACFAEKQLLFTKRLQKQAEAQGTPLLKISAKPGNDRLEMKPVIVEHGHATVVAKKAIKQGQWVPSEENACKSTVAAVAVDGADQGKTSYVCADQSCKVHKHTVTKPVSLSASAGGRKQESWEVEREREKAKAKAEHEVRRRMLEDFTPSDIKNSGFLAMYFVEELCGDGLNRPERAALCERLGIPFDANLKPGMLEWQIRQARDQASAQPLKDWVGPADDTEQHALAFHVLALNALSDDHWIDGDAMPLLHRMLDRAGYDAKATEAEVRKQIEAEKLGLAVPSGAPDPEPEKPAKKKLTAAEQAARKKTATKKHAPKTRLTPQQNKRFEDAKQLAKKLRLDIDGKSAAAGAAAEVAGA